MNFCRYPSREDASKEAASRISRAIGAGLDGQANTTIAVSGGTTPLQCYQQLSVLDLDWSSVQITLTDERCVPTSHPDSNTRMLNQHLITNKAAAASFQAIEHLRFARPFAAVLLGMGEDGHFASIFPDAQELPQSVDLTCAAASHSTTTAASNHVRTTLNLTALVNTPTLILLAFGNTKRRIIEQPDGLPVQHLLNQQHTPVEVIWAE